MERLRQELSRRYRRLRATAIPIAQCAVAAGLAWSIAKYVIGHPLPFFAPIAATISLGVSLGQRTRRAIELVVGVSIGIGVGDLLISFIGTGPWQITLVVALAMATAVALDSGNTIVLQAASSSVLVATLLPPATAGGPSRMIDAAVGGLVGFAVASLLPANPLAVAHRNGRVVLGSLENLLRGVASAIARQNETLATEALTRARTSQRSVEEFRSALQAGREIAKFAPLRWRHRTDLERYQTASAPIDRALRNGRVLARRAAAALRDSEPVPTPLPGLLERLSRAVVLLRDELAEGTEPLRARKLARAVAQASSVELLEEGDFSMQVVVLQVRSIAVDLLQATGVSRAGALEALPSLHPDDDVDAEDAEDAATREDAEGNSEEK